MTRAAKVQPLRMPVPGAPDRVAQAREEAEYIAALMLRPWLTVEQAATVVQSSAITIRRAIASGHLTALRLGRGQWRVTPDDLRVWMQKSPEESR